MKFSKTAYVLSALISIISLISIIVNCLILAEIGGFVNNNMAITVTSLICSILLLTLCVLIIFNCKYDFKESGLYIWFGISLAKYNYEDILAVAVDKKDNKLYVQFRSQNKKKEFDILAININTRLNEAFIDEIIKHNPNIVRPTIDTTQTDVDK